ncbi:hypothetical protein AB0G74_02250 [Streptomyces sp. NPDC020875]|uniref:hypothetical protein n=1 Tax=Streptomyces sp. NPDC020875 TaxID=3154898 RepID=UPI00340C891A
MTNQLAQELISHMRDAIARLFTHLGLRAAPPVRESAPCPPPMSPWSRPWTTPTQGQAQAILRARAEVERTLELLRPVVGPPPRHMLYVAPQGLAFREPVPVLTNGPSPGWGWLR